MGNPVCAGLPWEVTLGGFCVFAVIFSAVYAKRTEVALGICSILFVLMPTYFVHNFEIPFNNWLLGSVSPMSASKGEVLSALTLTLILTLTLTLTLTLPPSQPQ